MAQEQNIKNHPIPGAERPSEEEIEAMLGEFRPVPGPRFYSRMAGAPWASASNRVNTPRPRLSRTFAGSLAILLLLLLASLAVPSVRATAQRIAWFFLRSEGDRSTVSVIPQEVGNPGFGFPLTVAEAAAQAGFPVYEPAGLPPDLYLNGAVYLPESHAVILDYQTESSNQVMRLTQQWVGKTESFASIGASAEVETVRIGEYAGEYVSGGWRHPGLATPLANAAPGMKITLEASWDPGSGIQVLRWQQEDMLYEILNIQATTPNASNLDKADLVAIAASMQ